MKKCIFLDRDGTINKYKELLHTKNELELEDGAAEAIKRINKSEYLCIVVTNQPVVARNLCSIEEAIEINNYLEDLLIRKNGSTVDAIYMCPHHPDRGYPEENKEFKIVCDCRKPKIGMIMLAQKKYDIDLNSSFLIGDTTIDIQTGKNAGLKTVLLNTGLKGDDNKFLVEPDIYAKNLLEAVDKILGENKDETKKR
jgi:histidinol-phosphate phosphatase family protein